MTREHELDPLNPVPTGNAMTRRRAARPARSRSRASAATRSCGTLALCAAVILAGASAASAGPKPRLRGLPPPTGAPKNKRPEAGGLARGVVQVAPTAGTRDSDTSGTYRCNSTWVWIANTPSGYVEGNCAYGDGVLARKVSGLADGNYYLGGYIGGGYNGCGWIRTDYAWGLYPSSSTACGTPSRSSCDFIYCVGSALYVWDDDSGRDGLQMTIPRDCLLYGNFRPWLSGQTPTEPLHVISRGSQIKIRYLTRYTFNNQYFVMVHDLNSSYPSGKGNWGFLPQGCLA
jgi:hypothetical protein